MGGTVAVTLRDVDGTEYRMSRWTNSMPWGICNAKMFQKDPQHIANYVKQWLEMKADHEANKDTGEFEFNMTDCYHPSPGLCPDGYGLVVVDLMNDVILDMQGYSSFDYISVASVSLSISGNIIGEDEDDNEVTRLKDLWDAGYVKGWVTNKSFKLFQEGKAEHSWEEIPFDFDGLIKAIGSHDGMRHAHTIVIEGPFKYEKFEEYNLDALKAMRDRVKELGFVLNEQEEKYWEESIKEAQEYADEE
jgi:hypothetical protein